MVAPSLHCKGQTYAITDGLYLHPDYRGKGIGSGLIEVSEAMLKTQGVDVVMVTSKINTPLGSLLPHIGYTHTENIYTKYLGKN